MLRFIIRTISVVCLALSVMFLIIDATRSVGVSELVWTPMAKSWGRFFPESLTSFSTWLSTTAHPLLNDPVLATLLNLPTFVVFAGLAALFYIIGYKRRRRSDYFLDN
ncbi:MAG: hypothetical protein AAGF25_04385 [Pseudomonadota bacterium]